MHLKSLLYYTAALVFLSWCALMLRNDIAQINFSVVWHAPWTVLIAALLSLNNYFLRVLRWCLYLSGLGHRPNFGFSALTYLAGFAFTLSPGKVGELVRGRYLQKVGIPLTHSAAAFFMERLMDLLVMIALAFLTLTSTYRPLIWIVVIIILFITISLIFMPWLRLSIAVSELAWLPERLKKLLHTVVGMLLSAKALLRPKLLVTGFLLGLLAWAGEGVGLLVISDMSDGTLMTMSTAIGIYAIAVIVGALSFLPGGLGSTEAVMIALLNNQGYPMPDAILLTLVCRLLTLWLAVAIGWLAVWILRFKS